MGAASSYSLIGNQLVQLSNKQGTSIKYKTATDILKTVHEVSPWFLNSGDLSVVDGEQVRIRPAKGITQRWAERPNKCYFFSVPSCQRSTS